MLQDAPLDGFEPMMAGIHYGLRAGQVQRLPRGGPPRERRDRADERLDHRALGRPGRQALEPAEFVLDLGRGLRRQAGLAHRPAQFRLPGLRLPKLLPDDAQPGTQHRLPLGPADLALRGRLDLPVHAQLAQFLTHELQQPFEPLAGRPHLQQRLALRRRGAQVVGHEVRGAAGIISQGGEAMRQLGGQVAGVLGDLAERRRRPIGQIGYFLAGDVHGVVDERDRPHGGGAGARRGAGGCLANGRRGAGRPLVGQPDPRQAHDAELGRAVGQVQDLFHLHERADPADRRIPLAGPQAHSDAPVGGRLGCEAGRPGHPPRRDDRQHGGEHDGVWQREHRDLRRGECRGHGHLPEAGSAANPDAWSEYSSA